MITETRSTEVYIITHEELVDALLRWETLAREEDWERDLSLSAEEVALQNAVTLVEFLNQ